jgi:hypothetical protein
MERPCAVARGKDINTLDLMAAVCCHSNPPLFFLSTIMLPRVVSTLLYGISNIFSSVPLKTPVLTC